MFKFDFQIEDIDDDETNILSASTPQPQEDKPTLGENSFEEHLLKDLLNRLPSRISYSPLHVPLTGGRSLTLVRRDLFDARFQLISEGTGEEAPALVYLDAPSDLVPGVYEGGLKTWECSLDLVQYLDTALPDETYRGRRILELGCGTAVPSLYILRELFSSTPTAPQKGAHVHFQDFNLSVLELVTLPNILSTWYASPASLTFRCEQGSDDDLPTPIDPSTPSELSITPELKSAFLTSLLDHNLSIRFFSGSWSDFDHHGIGGKYDIILTSETIYSTSSLPSLVDTMQSASATGGDKPLNAHTSPQLTMSQSIVPAKYLCLVAAKVLYFGVGGGASEFTKLIETPANTTGRSRGKVETVLERKVGVGRKVMSVQWA
ncbi:uncharacterized protein LACBIDRAFT_189982 [Laccaria bicolor S238N-H82]|uniref:protein-histidine N-methyltransferase n=1 Tax=Laccaria bicolor (strain S238N-H82 / ATCC MYA-4686) TaxID=486041 RepID=B0D820_LACBS|nr:uncharacterized protein LACBIDRAFT_189982 [Laccaria bicolor S238N-H82]EDR09503.1 predicted protein [Laccaria bicolor S238N-H82]|eukprot:XP_001879852.1 predicted protein [Laccaria bicolor S238N-H82]